MYYPKLVGVNTQLLSVPGHMGDYTGGVHSCGVGGACGDSSSQNPLAAVTAESWIIAHGVLMIAAWCLLLPVGVAVAMFRKAIVAKGGWFRLHFGIQLSGLVVAVSGFALAVSMVSGASGHFSGSNAAHKILGLVIMIIAVMQP